MDEITLAMLNRMKKNGQVGYVENNSFTFDGKADGKLVLLNSYVRVTTKPFDLAQVETVWFFANGQPLSYPVGTGGLLLVKGEPLSAIVDSNNTPIVFVCTEEHYNEQYGTNIPVGVYVIKAGDSYVSAVSCFEVIHPIDPKFIPGVVLPKIVLDEEDYAAMYNTEAVLGEKHTAILDKAVEDYSPVIVAFYSPTDNLALSNIAPLSMNDDLMQLYETTLGVAKFGCVKHSEVGWVAKIEVPE